MIRYESLFTMTERLTTADSVAACATAAADHLKHVANVTAWRVLIQRDPGFLAVEASRSGTETTELVELEAWDAARWSTTRPTQLDATELRHPTAGAPERITNPAINSLVVYPFQRQGQPRCVLVAASRAEKWAAIDLKFLNMAGALLCDQLSTVVLRLQMIRTLEEHAWRDGLTDIANRRAVMEILTMEMSTGRRHRHPLGVLLADVDHFKSVNDTFGHHVGDIVLKETARRLTALAREGDSVGRYGGEEFLFVLHHCSSDGLRAAGDRIRTRFSDFPFTVEYDHHPFGLPITLSLGGASTDVHPDVDAEGLIRLADEALYEAKNAGRNRVEIRRAEGLTVSAESPT